MMSVNENDTRKIQKLQI